jgi:hypothetical protein
MISDSPWYTFTVINKHGHEVFLSDYERLHHKKAAERHERAARYPWLSVEPANGDELPIPELPPYTEPFDIR